VSTALEFGVEDSWKKAGKLLAVNLVCQSRGKWKGEARCSEASLLLLRSVFEL
jgi:hypothetical protein